MSSRFPRTYRVGQLFCGTVGVAGVLCSVPYALIITEVSWDPSKYGSQWVQFWDSREGVSEDAGEELDMWAIKLIGECP